MFIEAFDKFNMYMAAWLNRNLAVQGVYPLWFLSGQYSFPPALGQPLLPLWWLWIMVLYSFSHRGGHMARLGQTEFLPVSFLGRWGDDDERRSRWCEVFVSFRLVDQNVVHFPVLSCCCPPLYRYFVLSLAFLMVASRTAMLHNSKSHYSLLTVVYSSWGSLTPKNLQTHSWGSVCSLGKFSN